MLKRNIIANFLGNGWTALVTLGCVPLYIHFMGIEAYGLVGFFSVLMGVFSLLDMGLSATLSREMARLSGLADKAQEMRNLVRTLEVVYWAVAAVLAVVVISCSSLIAHNWVKAGQLSPQTVRHAIVLMGLAIALQWPLNFYAGGLVGLQRQVLLNSVNVVMATMRGGEPCSSSGWSPPPSTPFSAGKLSAAVCESSWWPYCSGAACPPPGWRLPLRFTCFGVYGVSPQASLPFPP